MTVLIRHAPYSDLRAAIVVDRFTKLSGVEGCEVISETEMIDESRVQGNSGRTSRKQASAELKKRQKSCKMQCGEFVA
jgi:hypothetical protein